jgi:transposase
MWTPTTRQQHSRPVTRYQTDLTDAEWRVVAPHLPKPCVKGRPRAWPMREIVNGIFYVMRSGCPWRLLPNDLPPWGKIYSWLDPQYLKPYLEAVSKLDIRLSAHRIMPWSP